MTIAALSFAKKQFFAMLRISAGKNPTRAPSHGTQIAHNGFNSRFTKIVKRRHAFCWPAVVYHRIDIAIGLINDGRGCRNIWRAFTPTSIQSVARGTSGFVIAPGFGHRRCWLVTSFGSLHPTRMLSNGSERKEQDDSIEEGPAQQQLPCPNRAVLKHRSSKLWHSYTPQKKIEPAPME